MSGKSFIDTNILVYCFDAAAPKKKEAAVKLVLDLWDSRQGVLSLQVLKEFFVTVTQKLPNKIDFQDARRAVEDFFSWEIAKKDQRAFSPAMEISHRNQISFGDASVIASAVVSDCSIIYSEDLSHGQVLEGVKVVNPFE